MKRQANLKKYAILHHIYNSQERCHISRHNRCETANGRFYYWKGNGENFSAIIKKQLPEGLTREWPNEIVVV